ncbi:MAG: hypothetical protein Q9208_007687 [Pyrenodesmia sp. 3 TL-2023]
MKTTLFTAAATFVGSIVANPVYKGDDLAASIVEERQYDYGGGYGGASNACQQLIRRYPQLTAYPSGALYPYEQSLFWSKTTILAPYCVFAPKTAQDVAGAMRILVATNTRFAMRSGGHMPNPGSNNVNGGVLIGLDRLNSTKIAQVGGVEVAQVGPGLRWAQVYEYTSKLGKMVNGGRYSPVGVGGLLIGGGLSYFGSQNGWASNLVVQFEVVLANSSIVYVNKQSYPDLYWALKGGSSNFGIVTRYDLKTFPLNDVYAGFFNQNAARIPALLKATEEYITPVTGGSLDARTSIDVTIFFNATSRLFSATTSIFCNASVSVAPPSLVNFTKIPTTAPSTVRRRTYVDFETDTEFSADRSFRQLFRGTSLKSRPVVVKFAYDIFKTKAQTLKPVPGLLAVFVYQPLTVALLRKSRANGGDAMDLDPADGPIMALIINVAWKNAADDVYVNAWAKDLLDTVDAQAKAKGYFNPFIFLNDAQPDQRVFASYGKGTSFPKLRAAAAKYDPTQVFQKLDAGGFKVSTQ